MTKRAARAALPPALLGASHARRRPRRRPFFQTLADPLCANPWWSKARGRGLRGAWEASSSAGRAAARAQRVLRCL